MAKADIKKVKSLDDFDALFKSATVDKLALARNAGFITTGSISFDKLLNGGLPKGTMVEYYGEPQSGKSTAALAAVGHVVKAGGNAIWFDLERGLDLVNEAKWLDEDIPDVTSILAAREEDAQAHVQKRQSWLRTNGIDPFHPNFRIYDPEHGEEMFSMIDTLVSNNLCDIVVVDSVATIVTRAELEGEPGESHYGQVAKLLSTELKRVMRLYSGNSNTTIIWINQIRDKIGYMAKGKKSTGGHALEHFVGTKVRFTKIGRKDVGTDVQTETRVKVDKSRYASAREITLFISGQRGLDTLSELLDYAVDFGYVRASGNWMYFFDEPVDAEAFKAAQGKKVIPEIPGFVTSVNGKASALEFMSEHGWREKLYPLAVKAA